MPDVTDKGFRIFYDGLEFLFIPAEPGTTLLGDEDAQDNHSR